MNSQFILIELFLNIFLEILSMKVQNVLASVQYSTVPIVQFPIHQLVWKDCPV